MANKRVYTHYGKKPSESKYKAVKTVVDGIVFDSKAEAARYKELLLLQRAGKIRALERQKRFELQPSFKKNGQTFRAVSYIADFVYFDVENNCVVVEDAKGMRTEVYKIKRKLFEFEYPDLTIREITRR